MKLKYIISITVAFLRSQKVVKELNKRVQSETDLAESVADRQDGSGMGAASRVQALRKRLAVALAKWRTWLEPKLELYADEKGNIVWEEGVPPEIPAEAVDQKFATFPVGRHIKAKISTVSPREVGLNR